MDSTIDANNFSNIETSPAHSALKERLMKPVRRAQGIASVEIGRANDPDRRGERLEVIKDMPFPRKLGAGAIFFAAEKSPVLLESALNWSFTRAGYEVIGSGYFSTAIKSEDGTSVKKVIRSSMDASRDERVSMASSLRDEAEWTEKVFPENAVPSTVQVSELFLRRPTEAVMIEQPFIEHYAEAVAPSDADMQFDNFARRALGHEDAGQKLPDVVGRDNLFFDKEGQLRLVDTIPIHKDRNESCYNEAREKLEAMLIDQDLREQTLEHNV